MTEELIKDRHSSYTPQAPLAFETPLQIQGTNPFNAFGQYTNTVASCRDYPIPSHAAKKLFVEPEQEIHLAQRKDNQQQQKLHFLKRLSVANIKIRIVEFTLKIHDTLSSWKNRLWNTFRGVKQDKKLESSSKKAEHKKEISKIDEIERRRIQEIEDASAIYAEELKKSGGGDMKAMIEMACKLIILVGSLGSRFSKKEIRDYMDHLEKNIEERKKTYQGGHKWTYISIGLYTASAAFSFASMGGGFCGSTVNGEWVPNAAGRVLTGLGHTTTPLSHLGQGSGQVSQIDEAKRTGERTGLEHISEKLKQVRADMDRNNEKTHQASQEALAAMRNLIQTDAEASKRALAF